VDREHTRVLIIGAGPAGLLLSHLLAASDIESTVLDCRERVDIETTVRAGILEAGTVDVLAGTGASTRVLTEGTRHEGIELRFNGEGHRIDFTALTGRCVWLYPQHEVLRDLIATRLAAGQDLRFGVTVKAVRAGEGQRVRVDAVDSDGSVIELEADFVVGADGSRSVVREAVSGSATNGYFREYPFAWFGILCEAPPSSPELIYSNSDAGFALVSQRSATVQRMYLQCDPELDPHSIEDDKIWDSLEARVAPHPLIRGKIFQRDVLRFRSFVSSRLRNGPIALVGDAAHTVPPTGAKGLNLAVADVIVLAKALRALLLEGNSEYIDRYEDDVLVRVWKAQHFSWWMTQMLHRSPDSTDFDRYRQIGELQSVVDSEAGRRFLAEAYTGWPLPFDEVANHATHGTRDG